MGGGAGSAGARAVGDIRRSGWQTRVAEGLNPRVAFVVGLGGVGRACVCVFEDDAGGDGWLEADFNDGAHLGGLTT